MSYNGKLPERRRTRELRAQSWTLQEIADELGVAKSSVSLWAGDVEFEPRPRRRRSHWTRDNPHPMHVAKLEEIERCRREGAELIGTMSEREFLVAGLTLYAGEGGKTGGDVRLTNSDPRLICFFVSWLRHFFDTDESKFRMRLYLHQHLDLERAIEYWSGLTGIPREQFGKPYRAVVDTSIRKSKHTMGCPCVVYYSTSVLRRVMGMMEAVICTTAFPG